jgi:hypothetical protein
MPLAVLFAAVAVVASPPVPADAAGRDPFDISRRVQLNPSLRGAIVQAARPGALALTGPFVPRLQKSMPRLRPGERPSVKALLIDSAAAPPQHRDDEQGPVILELGDHGLKTLHCTGHLVYADPGSTAPYREDR